LSECDNDEIVDVDFGDAVFCAGAETSSDVEFGESGSEAWSCCAQQLREVDFTGSCSVAYCRTDVDSCDGVSDTVSSCAGPVFDVDFGDMVCDVGASMTLDEQWSDAGSDAASSGSHSVVGSGNAEGVGHCSLKRPTTVTCHAAGDDSKWLEPHALSAMKLSPRAISTLQ